MATNSIPNQLDQAFPMAQKMVDGLKTHGTTVGVLHNTATKLEADLQAAREAENTYQGARAERQLMSPALKEARKAGTTFITNVKNVLKPHLGQSWNTRWAEAGFVNNSLRNPVRVAEQEEMLKILAAFFTEHTGWESAGHGVTAARALELYDTLKTADKAAQLLDVNIGEFKQERDAAVKQLKSRMRGLIAELKQLLTPLDSRWAAFGLNAPGAISRAGETQRTKAISIAERGEVVASLISPSTRDRDNVGTSETVALSS